MRLRIARYGWLGLALTVVTSLAMIENTRALASPQAVLTPILIGDTGRQLSSSDITALERALPAGERVWLISGDPGQTDTSQTVVAYLQPQNPRGAVRRGSSILLRRRLSPLTPWNVVDWSTLASNQGMSANYAQVAVPGRSFDQIQGDDDPNRPFFTIGELSDAELQSIAGFIRSKPNRPNTPGVPIASGPIVSVSRQSSTSAKVGIRLAPMATQHITIRQETLSWGTRWVIDEILERRA